MRPSYILGGILKCSCFAEELAVPQNVKHSYHMM